MCHTLNAPDTQDHLKAPEEPEGQNCQTARIARMARTFLTAELGRRPNLGDSGEGAIEVAPHKPWPAPIEPHRTTMARKVPYCAAMERKVPYRAAKDREVAPVSAP